MHIKPNFFEPHSVYKHLFKVNNKGHQSKVLRHCSIVFIVDFEHVFDRRLYVYLPSCPQDIRTFSNPQFGSYIPFSVLKVIKQT